MYAPTHKLIKYENELNNTVFVVLSVDFIISSKRENFLVNWYR